MDSFEKFRIWFENEADNETRQWAKQRTGSKEPREIFAALRRLSCANDGLTGEQPCSLKDITIFQFFPQIQGFYHHYIQEKRYHYSDELVGPDRVRGGLSTLVHLPHIRDLHIVVEDDAFEDLPPLPHVAHLTVEGVVCEDFSWLKGWGSLVSFCFDEVADFSHAPPNQNLSRLKLRGPCKDLSGAAQYPGLMDLTVVGAKIEHDLDLSHCEWLQEVVFCGSSFSNITLLLPQLKRLTFRNCNLETLNLKKKDIHSLRIEDCIMPNLEWVGEDLVELHILRCNIASLPDLSGSSCLRSLHVEGAQIETLDFDRLPGCLKIVNLKGSSLSEIAGTPVKSLEYVNLSGCGLPETETSKLAGLTQTTMYLNGNLLGAAFLDREYKLLIFDTKLSQGNNLRISQARALYLRHKKLGGDEAGFDAGDSRLTEFAIAPLQAVLLRFGFAGIGLVALSLLGLFFYLWVSVTFAPSEKRFAIHLEQWHECHSRYLGDVANTMCGEEPQKEDYLGH